MEQSPKKRGRPVGKFNENKERVYVFLKNLQETTGNELLHVSNQHVSDALGVCQRQASRYMNALVNEGRIHTQIRRCETDVNRWTNIRIVQITENQ